MELLHAYFNDLKKNCLLQMLTPKAGMTEIGDTVLRCAERHLRLMTKQRGVPLKIRCSIMSLCKSRPEKRRTPTAYRHL